MGQSIQHGSSDVSTIFRIIDEATGIPYDGAIATGLTLWYRREMTPPTAPVDKVESALSTLALITTAHTDWGMKFLSDGYYRFDLPDAASVVGADAFTIGGSLSGYIIIGNSYPLVPYSAPQTADNDTHLSTLITQVGTAGDGLTNITLPGTIGTLDALDNQQDIQHDTTRTLVTDRSLLAADYFDPAVDVVARVTITDTTTTNLDMRGTESANTVAPDNASVAAILADSDELQQNQGAWATATGFNTTVPDPAGTAATPAEVASALATYDSPTNAEMEARTPTASQLLYMTRHAASAKPVTFSGAGTTTTGVIDLIDGVVPSATDDLYKGGVLVFNLGSNDEARTDITSYDGTTKEITVTAVPFPISSTNAALLV